MWDEKNKKSGLSKGRNKLVEWFIRNGGSSSFKKERKYEKIIREGVEFYSNGDFYEDPPYYIAPSQMRCLWHGLRLAFGLAWPRLALAMLGRGLLWPCLVEAATWGGFGVLLSLAGGSSHNSQNEKKEEKGPQRNMSDRGTH
ncbi:hypothetical protein NE237_000943 [Protea cynaroides]|uniref:Uncharacterized protein n=1 Tax=Protea cynaroides TaxID=273540 RepID=A0A9Q0QXY2_9MAGN|nr:hypothetical protein NE237_000943 [Protea cynaroides]